MAVRQRRRTTDTTESIRAVIGRIFSCGDFSPYEFPLPSEKGAQLSMTGEIIAYGNSGEFNSDALRAVLSSIPSVRPSTDRDIERYTKKNCYTVLCGDCDRSVAMISAITEMLNAGITKIIIAADTPTERDNIVQSLTLMRAGIDGTDISAYRADDYESFVKYKASATICGFLTSDTPEIFVLSRDCFSRKNNIINRHPSDDPEEKSLAEVIGLAHAAVICSSPTISSGRTLARISEVFSPIVTMIFSSEVKNLRDAVIFRPETVTKAHKTDSPSEFEQIMF
ncbi:MAG: hypothetical protein E7672_08535 [Ruminococcaceae bacterium]|nr:hypothetical protein [Oscillospiraceae bacterium]